MKKIKLINGVYIPDIGFGTWNLPRDNSTIEAVKTAIECGFRQIDCAAAYGNEDIVGKAINESGAAREELFIVSKLHNIIRGYDETIAAFNKTLADLQIEYLDLYLIHWPVPKIFKGNYKEMNAESWRAFEDLYNQGKIKAIGVSNFKVHHMEELRQTAKIMPMVHQVEFHPSCLQKEIIDYCRQNNITVQGYSPLAHGMVFKCREVVEIAEKCKVSVAQLCVKYVMQHNIIPIVKSVSRERIMENMELDFTISDNDMKIIDEITTCASFGVDSDNTDF